MKEMNAKYLAASLLLMGLLVAHPVHAQKKAPVIKSPWSDTTFIPVALADTLKSKKIIIVNIGKKAIIYLPVQPLIDSSKKALDDDFIKKDYQRIIDYLDSASATGDSIFYDGYLYCFDYLVAEQMRKGNARVYYKKQGIFVDIIFHRLERYGAEAPRFFYLPDRRPFYSVLEYSGIMDSDDDDSWLNGGEHFREYVKEGEKIASLRKE